MMEKGCTARGCTSWEDKANRLLRTHAAKSPRIASATPYSMRAECPTAATKRLPPAHSPTLARKMAYSAPQEMSPGLSRWSRVRRACVAYSLKFGVATDSITADFMALPSGSVQGHTSALFSYYHQYTSGDLGFNSRCRKDRCFDRQEFIKKEGKSRRGIERASKKWRTDRCPGQSGLEVERDTGGHQP
jgi:hypothetical protein